MHVHVAVTAVLVVLFSINCSNPTPPSPSVTPTPETFGESLEGDELAWYNRISNSERRDIEFFYSVVGYDATYEWLTTKVRRQDDGTYSTRSLPSLTVPLPTFEESFTTDELAKLKSLDERLHKTLVEDWESGAHIQAPAVEPLDREVFVASRVDQEFRRLRKILADLPSEIPPVADLLHADGLEVYRALDPEWQERFLDHVARTYVRGQVTGGIFPSFGDWEVKNLFNGLIFQYQGVIATNNPKGL